MNTSATPNSAQAKNGLLAVIGLIAAGFSILWLLGGVFNSGAGDGRPSVVSGPSLVVGPPSADSTHWKAVVSVTNVSEQRGYKIVGVQCTWFSGGAAIDSSGLPVMNVPWAQTVHASATGPYSERAVDRVSCRVDYARPN